MFTIEQYDKAIEALQLARQQHIDDTCDKGCSICGDCCHPDSCRFNPLHAMAICESIAKQSNVLHDTLHTLAGFETYMGEQTGPASIVVPGKSCETS